MAIDLNNGQNTLAAGPRVIHTISPEFPASRAAASASKRQNGASGCAGNLVLKLSITDVIPIRHLNPSRMIPILEICYLVRRSSEAIDPSGLKPHYCISSHWLIDQKSRSGAAQEQFFCCLRIPLGLYLGFIGATSGIAEFTGSVQRHVEWSSSSNAIPRRTRGSVPARRIMNSVRVPGAKLPPMMSQSPFARSSPLSSSMFFVLYSVPIVIFSLRGHFHIMPGFLSPAVRPGRQSQINPLQANYRNTGGSKLIATSEDAAKKSLGFGVSNEINVFDTNNTVSHFLVLETTP
ncbi:uncharacterized protein CLUP02_01632 [Colletotrichum lupini]|uniref:Uncharacterized protein n=1 Tax=Colletotrichum lupini TaxID=145971 RepID=A0A9Q8W9C5_9PEZI|nr:uncharacterized protein CLUP02_01632 [Colletotrichum lupini]UQC74979.1 hypothetical protein CLUP02_01632 [Colletotrichum lupini]